jgi:hypothetical protein
MTANTSRYLSSTEKTERRATERSLHEEPDTNPPARNREAGQAITVAGLREGEIAPLFSRGELVAGSGADRQGPAMLGGPPVIGFRKPTLIAGGVMPPGVPRRCRV